MNVSDAHKLPKTVTPTLWKCLEFFHLIICLAHFSRYAKNILDTPTNRKNVTPTVFKMLETFLAIIIDNRAACVFVCSEWVWNWQEK